MGKNAGMFDKQKRTCDWVHYMARCVCMWFRMLSSPRTLSPCSVACPCKSDWLGGKPFQSAFAFATATCQPRSRILMLLKQYSARSQAMKRGPWPTMGSLPCLLLSQGLHGHSHLVNLQNWSQTFLIHHSLPPLAAGLKVVLMQPVCVYRGHAALSCPKLKSIHPLAVGHLKGTLASPVAFVILWSLSQTGMHSPAYLPHADLHPLVPVLKVVPMQLCMLMEPEQC